MPVPDAKASYDRKGVGLPDASFKSLYAQHLGLVRRYAGYRLEPDDADDATAEAFARAWRDRGQFDPLRGSPEAWLWTIARHAVADRLRERQRAGQATTIAGATVPSPGAVVERAVIWSEVVAAMPRLAPMDQDIIALRYGSGLTNRAIAEQLQMGEANVAQRLRRALAALRTAVGEVGRP